ncbi:MAG: carboxypeptidase-like regulatory domain-containing protein, partial [Ignavibacteria bacterium]|nr:carboxypeptidase-like regulatory domain-containing protein [Ignavibacteria bacterium]
MNKAIKYLVLVLVLCLSKDYAQARLINPEGGGIKSGMLTGVVIDSLTNTPLPLVNFQLFELKDTTKMLGTTTRSDGKFILTKIPFGSYSARISFVGYKKRKRSLIVLN